MASLSNFVQDFLDSGRLETMARNPMAQFLDPNTGRQFKGAALFPRMPKERNEYKESAVRIIVYPARDNSPYSPPILQNAFAKAEGQVVLGHIDTGSQLTGQQLEDLMTYFRTGAEKLGQQTFLRWLNSVVAGSLAIKGEIQNWELIIDGQVTISIDNTDYVANYDSPAENRFNATGDWNAKTNGVSDFDPFVDITAAWQLLWNLGFDLKSMHTSNVVAGVMANNTKVKERAGYLTTKNGQISNLFGMSPDNLGFVNQALSRSGEAGGRAIPPIELYDLNYEIQDAGVDTAAQPSLSKQRKYFLPRNCFVVIGESNSNYPIFSEDALNSDILGEVKNALGYTGVGHVPTYEQRGIISKLISNSENDKLKGYRAEAYMQCAPVMTERTSQCVVVIKNIATGFS